MKKDFMTEFKRKFLVHMGIGLIMSFYFYIAPTFVFQITIISLLAIGLVYRRYLIKKINYPFINELVNNIGRENETGNGTIFFFCSALIVSIFFSKNTAIIAILVLSVSDSLATLIGKFLGKIKIYKKKTLEGSLAFLFSSFLIIFSYTQNLLMSLYVSIISSLVELFTPLDDNLVVAPICAFFISLF